MTTFKQNFLMCVNLFLQKNNFSKFLLHFTENSSERQTIKSRLHHLRFLENYFVSLKVFEVKTTKEGYLGKKTWASWIIRGKKRRKSLFKKHIKSHSCRLEKKGAF